MMQEKPSEYFGCDVFSFKTMQTYFNQDVLLALQNTIEKKKPLPQDVANAIAEGMMQWAMKKNVTHYTHWFQPLTGTTAEKHDAFLSFDKHNQPISQFDGRQLIQQEPDASSFPNGGIRNTFEARGYTAWDPSSPAFIYNETLCIPTIFISYTGEALDYKTPLLRSIESLNQAATQVCQLFDSQVQKVTITLGWEQEYFLIDKELHDQRLDLKICKRSLFGKSAQKGQIMEDHYFGSIPERVQDFMKDFEEKAWRLGIPVKTRHNEVAPNQFELAPIFEEVNIAIDHNQLVMDLMQKVAYQHDLVVLLHEKPFGGINGSGKHNNWSMATDTGINLLSPGKTPEKNIQFLTFFVNTIKAVYDHADLLRASIASAGNDHRLGANEAPPAIMSVFIGSYLTEILGTLEKKVTKSKMTDKALKSVKLDVTNIPFIFDNTDRNRTSPFAFTGNKFEFRAVGSSANCSGAMQVLNTIVANQLLSFKAEYDKMMKGDKMTSEEVILRLLKKYVNHSKPILFEGNGYGEEWVEEARQRGLSNLKTTPEALKAYVSESSKALFNKLGIITEKELEARYEIALETYVKLIEIEAKVLEDMIYNQIIPSCINYESILLNNVRSWRTVVNEKTEGSYADYTLMLAKEIAEQHNSILIGLDELKKARNQHQPSLEAEALHYAKTVVVILQKIRTAIDNLELIVDQKEWSLPKYKDLLSSL